MKKEHLTPEGKMMSFVFLAYMPSLLLLFLGPIETRSTIIKFQFVSLIFLWKLFQLLTNFVRAKKEEQQPPFKDVYIHTMNQPFFSLK